MSNESIAFASGELSLEGIFTASERASVATGLIICHPHPLYGGDMQNNVVRALAGAFEACGHAVLRFNFRGVGKSTGTSGTYGEGIGEQEDARAAMTWLAAHPGANVDRLWLVGYSFGARVTLAVAASDPRVHGFIAVAPPIRRGALPRLTSFPGPKLFLSGEADPYAPPEFLAPWVESLPAPKRLIILRGVNHFFWGHERTLGQQAATLLHEHS
jgi:alpha/beta superfamily hydrolase